MAPRSSSALALVIMAVLLLAVALCGRAEARSLLQKTNSTEGGEGRRELAKWIPGDYLVGHTAARKQVGLPALTWNTNASNAAQKWANHLRRSGCDMEHGGRPGFGQNLAWGSAALAPQDAVQMWVDERDNYTRSLFNPPDASGCGTGYWGDCAHYTQIVWNGTQGVGCGAARCPDNSTIVVCDYYPPGNWVGGWPY